MATHTPKAEMPFMRPARALLRAEIKGQARNMAALARKHGINPESFKAMLYGRMALPPDVATTLGRELFIPESILSQWRAEPPHPNGHPTA